MSGTFCVCSSGDQAAALGGLGLEAGGFGGDFDGLGEFAQLEFDAFQDEAFGGGEPDVGLLVAFEAIRGNLDLVSGGEQLGEGEVTVAVGLQTANLVGGNVGEDDLGAGDRRAGLVRDTARQVSGEALAEKADGGKRCEQQRNTGVTSQHGRVPFRIDWRGLGATPFLRKGNKCRVNDVTPAIN